MIAEITGLGALGLLVTIHFAYSVVTAHKAAAEYSKLTQKINHLGTTSVATGFKPRVVGN
jgi:hypothetical protein